MNKSLIKILIIGMSNNLGGIETYIYNLYKNADKNKFRFDFVDINNGSMLYRDELENNGCKVFDVCVREKNYIKHLSDFKEIFLNNQYDYVHFHIMSYSWFEPIIMANKYSNAKIIVHSHCGSPNYLRKNYFVNTICDYVGKNITKNIPYIRVACGKQAGEYMFKNKEYIVFNNGIDLDKFKFNIENRKEIRESLGIKNNFTVYGLVATFLATKNHNFLIDVFNEILKKDKSSKLVLIGVGPLQREIIDKVDRLGIKNSVLFLGRRMDVNKIYSAMDVFVMPSFVEGLPISLIEAQVNGLKCFGSTEIDSDVNITGNVNFISLNKSSNEWADIILNSDKKRDSNVLEKVPCEYNAKKSYKIVLEFYKNNV